VKALYRYLYEQLMSKKFAQFKTEISGETYKGRIDMTQALPATPEERMAWEWPQYEPIADELIERELDAGNLDEWLQDWSDLSEAMSEQYNRLYVAITVNTADEAAKQRFDNYMDTIFPRAIATENTLKEKLLGSGLTPDGFEIPLRNFRAEAALYREENLPLLAQEQKLATEYDRIIGAQTVEWEGEEVTLTQLNPVLQETDRERREKAWRLTAERQLQDRQALNELWQKFLPLRQQIASNAGKPGYRAYRWQQLLRFAYTPDDAQRFHQAIETAVVPAATRIYERRKRRLGVEQLRPWDLDVDASGKPPLRPFKEVSVLNEKLSDVFHHVHPELGDYFDVMVKEDLLDLENRKNKAPGGYCTAFEAVRKPFIFMNAVGTHDDVQTLLHEGGHAFHTFESAKLPYYHQMNVPMEFAEVASMSMELLASPYLLHETGGFYNAKEAARARIQHLEGAILFWPYMAVIDAFQHWAYENEALARDPANCDKAFSELWDRFMQGVDWSGLQDEKETGWHRKLHIFTVPFYYVEYGLAQLGAVQVWANSLSNPVGAVEKYREGLRLGGTAPLPDLFRAVGARLSFDAATLDEAVKLMETTIETLEQVE
jgi:oligoendopeptidase F